MSAAHASPDIVGRPDRSQRASDELVLRPPPPLERSEGGSGVLMNALPMLGSLGSILLVATAGGSGQTGRQYLSAGLFLFATVGFVVVQIDRQRTRKQHGMAARRAGYLRYLDTVRDTVRGAAAQQRRALGRHHPPPTSLPALAAEGSRVWERGPSDPRFLQVRYGVSDQPLALRLVPPETAPDSAEVADPVAAAALRRLLSVHRVQPGLPDTLDLRAVARIQLTGSEEQARSTARALVCSATAFHAPRHLLVAVLTTEEGRVHWDWLKWLPHAHSTRATDALGRQRLVATTRADLAALLPADLTDRPRFGADERPLTPHILVIVDDVPLPADDPLLPASGRNGVTVLDLSALDAPPLGAGMLRLGPEGRDACDLQVAEAFARRLAPLRGAVPGPGPQAHGGGATDLMALLEIGDPRALDPAVSWRPRPACARLRVPIGTDEDGAPVHLDLKEAAQQGMGPHGLVIGATGSGKSELLRTLVVGLAVSHPPDQVNFVLVDFKGGATLPARQTCPTSRP
jgi:S-DNA-T family DNA segregation ATPase FtsK/SpoIIIE